MRPRSSQQRDLFEADRTMTDFPIAQKPLLVRLIECLLVEALAADATHAANDKATEAAHEQDHA